MKKFQILTYYVITNERDRIRNFRYRSNGPDGSPRPSTKFCEKTRCATLTLKPIIGPPPMELIGKLPFGGRWDPLAPFSEGITLPL